jgi:CubicO group peptidase (beta-lactamase class C family)
MDLRGVAMVTRAGSVRAELASGQPYAQFLTERILSPLDLTATSIGGPPPEPAARGYRDGQPVTPFDLAAMAGTGDIWSTAADLARFTAGLHAGNLITNESLHAMLTPHAPIDDDDETLITTGYGYGMFTGTFAGHPAYYHPGDNVSSGWRRVARRCLVTGWHDEEE